MSDKRADTTKQSNDEVMRERIREALRPKPMSDKAARALFGDTEEKR